MIVLQNEDYFVKINLDGGQIARFKDEHKDIEYVFDADKRYWSYSTPTLFPVIGKSYDGKYHFDNKVTEMPQHGILRNARFTLMSHINNEVVLRFKANEKTYEQFPYYFTIDIKYTLVDNKLSIEYLIKNDGLVSMPFNFGLHPAFFCPLTKDKSFEDYKITFSSPTELKGFGPRVDDGLVSEIPLSYDSIEEYGTWIYHHLATSHVGITDGKHGVDVSVVGFPIVCVWTNTKNASPFVCIEPWLGRGKIIDADLPFEDRDAVMKLAPNRTLTLTYTISVY